MGKRKKGFHQRYIHESYKECKRICINCQHVYLHPDPELTQCYCNRTKKRPANPQTGEGQDKAWREYSEWQRWRMVAQYGYCNHFKAKQYHAF